ncbi:MAG: bifunctional indole-3-glycerol phosphate synthase/phosphoribosylanthranilate isomerase [Treponema sp.]|nr:MAG: bifunctional indole-3-glycerol phosphate synthase/phosphoribosylanthranilate isomerase [Treponema sp.]
MTKYGRQVVPDILDDIVRLRRADYARLGPSFGCDIPAHRRRPIVPFLAVPGAILEIKRASPSKGDIAPDLDPVSLAGRYAAAGAKQVSVLTESNFFKGTLEDLVAVSDAHPHLSFLRKDFILYEDEIEIAWRCGADAVLLIARILDTPLLLALAAKCRAFGMTPFIEVREESDVAKLAAACKAGTASGEGAVLAGVNSRDLATFRIDPLVPATLRTKLPCRAVFESGAGTPGSCRFARRLGFDGILIGEAAAKSPETAHELVSAFADARPDWVGQFWREIGRRAELGRRTELGRADSALRHDGAAQRAARPLVKICGLTNAEDALLAASLGADLLGFVFAPSPRRASAQAVRDINARLSASTKPKPDECAQPPAGSAHGACCAPPGQPKNRPLLVGVIVDPDSPEAKEAFVLAAEGVLDAVQYHGEHPETDLSKIDGAGGSFGIGRYAAVRLGGEADLERIEFLRASGEPRILLDARVEGIAGGTGKTIPKSLVRSASVQAGLWLAGGLNPANVRMYIEEFEPELIDASSGLESGPGKKDPALLKSFFREINR